MSASASRAAQVPLEDSDATRAAAASIDMSSAGTMRNVQTRSFSAGL